MSATTIAMTNATTNTTTTQCKPHAATRGKISARLASLLAVVGLCLLLTLTACGGGGSTSGSIMPSGDGGSIGGGGGTGAGGGGGAGGASGGGDAGVSQVILHDFTNTNQGSDGGIGRMTLDVDNQPAVVSVLDTENIARLLQSPDHLNQEALLLRIARVGNTFHDLFVWGVNDRPVYNPDAVNTLGTQQPVRTSDNLSRVHGFDYPLDSELNTQVYIDAYAPVVLAFRSRTGGGIGNVLTLGVPYGGESSLPRGTQTYAGAATLHGDLDGVAGGLFTAFRGGFTLTADFETAQVTNFSTEIELATTGDVTNMGNLAINLSDGTFTGKVRFDASKNSLIRQNAEGEIYGQFHGEGATAVTGLYHNGGTGEGLVFGGFAGGNTCLAIVNATTPTC
ncbi:MAG: hypothetical protein MJE68_22555 [Proteobacteria bacterium]|nr:hypothetical protein [Pseudomonadota bacterium]